MDSFVIVPLLHSVSDIIIADSWVGCLRTHIWPVGCVLATAADKVNTGGIGWFVRTSGLPVGQYSYVPQHNRSVYCYQVTLKSVIKVLIHILEIATGTERLCVVACSRFALQI
jgi:hypothetical protein